MFRYNNAIPGSPHTTLACGFSRSGKSNTAVHMYSNRKFPFKAEFGNGERVWLISPTHHVQSELWDKMDIPLDHRHRAYSEKLLENFIAEAENDTNRPRNPRLLLLDDCVADLPAKRQNNLIRILVYGRHLNCSCWVGVQYWSIGLSHLSKMNFTNYQIFPANHSEQESMYKQICGDISRDMFRKLCKCAWKEKYSFLNVDRTLDETAGKYGRNFEEKYHLKGNHDEGVVYKRCCGPKTEEQRRSAQESQRRKLPWRKSTREADYNAKNDAGLSRDVQGRGLPNTR